MRQARQPKKSITARWYKGSLANAKVSARQQCVYQSPYSEEIYTANQRKEHNVGKYIQWVTTLLLAIRVYV